MNRVYGDAAVRPLELAFNFPKVPHRRVNLHLTLLSSAIVLFLSTTDVGEGKMSCALGSFVYAMPDVRIVVTQTMSLWPHSLIRL